MRPPACLSLPAARLPKARQAGDLVIRVEMMKSGDEDLSGIAMGCFFGTTHLSSTVKYAPLSHFTWQALTTLYSLLLSNE